MNAWTKLFKRQRDATSDVFGGIAELRARIAVLADERARIDELPVPLEEALASVDRWLDDLEARHSLPVGGFTTGLPGSAPALTMGEHSILPSLFISACRYQIREAIADRLADHYEGKDAASASEKDHRLAEIDAELLGLCKVEERLVREAERSGLPILRRETAPVEIVLAPDEDLDV